MTVLPAAARWLAIAIALVAALDPAITATRATRPSVAVIAADPRDSALAADVAGRLEDDFVVVRGAFDGARASVIVGNALPERAPDGVVFGVYGAREIRGLDADFPDVGTTEARIPVRVSWKPDRNTRGGRVELIADGVVVDTFAAVPTNGFATAATLYVTPPSPGPLRLRVRVTTEHDSSAVDGVADVSNDKRAILFFDRRPSWMSTFARRALERDRRFAIASRTITSRNISTDGGQPPSTLADPAVLELYDAIVVGAPTLLTPADVAGLETFLRRRGGAVVLLLDEKPANAALDRLIDAGGWTGTSLRTPIVTDGYPVAMRVGELTWPSRLPADADTLVTSRVGTVARPVVWSTMVGRGSLIVSGALDAWKFRDANLSGFDEYWAATISRAALDAVPALDVRVSPSVLRPGDRARVVVTPRDTMAVAEATVAGRPLMLARVGASYEGAVVAPATAGELTIRATAGGARAARTLLVGPDLRAPMPDDSLAIATLALGSGGTVTSASGIVSAVRERVVVERRAERVWPMRSPWWILPFAGLLGVEWVVRRKRGMA